MKNFEKTQINEFGQPIGMNIQTTKNCIAAFDDISHGQLELGILTPALLKPIDQAQLWECVSAEPDLSCWTYLPYSGFENVEQLGQYLNHNFYLAGSTHYLIRVEQRCVGWIALMNDRPQDGVIEIGNVYFSVKMKRSKWATTCLYLLLAHCFSQGYRRVEWKCDAFNAPSYRAALRFGFQYEGTFRQHRINKGRNRNTAWFSMLDDEWPNLKLAYEAWLNADNFDAQGQQKMTLYDCKRLYLIEK